MEAKELRIGNLVKYSLSNIPQEIKSVINVHGEYIVSFQNSEFSNTIDKIKPIPLTEEFLLKLGFERGGYNLLEVWHPNNPRFSMVGYLGAKDDDDFLGWNYDSSGNSEEEWAKSRIDIKYIHQLQNLYFALTGEELTLTKTNDPL